jgi:hypothetical protein
MSYSETNINAKAGYDNREACSWLENISFIREPLLLRRMDLILS